MRASSEAMYSRLASEKMRALPAQFLGSIPRLRMTYSTRCRATPKRSAITPTVRTEDFVKVNLTEENNNDPVNIPPESKYDISAPGANPFLRFYDARRFPADRSIAEFLTGKIQQAAGIHSMKRQQTHAPLPEAEVQSIVNSVIQGKYAGAIVEKQNPVEKSCAIPPLPCVDYER
jgi:hypothetical protein